MTSTIDRKRLYRTIFNGFVYASLIFLLIALYRADYLRIPRIYSYPCLVLSLIAAFLSFIIYSYRWKLILDKYGLEITFRDSISSVGLSVFGKYVPGRIMTVVGQSAYISEHYGANIKDMALLSLHNQFAGLWMGMLFGFAGLLYYGGLKVWGATIFLLWLGITVIVFTDFFHRPAELVLLKIFRRQISIVRLNFADTISTLHWYIYDFLMRSIGFYLLARSMSTDKVGIAIGLGFALAQVAGMAVIFMPGGIGVREGVLAAYLKLAGLSLADSATISVASRLWFLIAECFIFILGTVCRRFANSSQTLTS